MSGILFFIFASCEPFIKMLTYSVKTITFAYKRVKPFLPTCLQLDMLYDQSIKYIALELLSIKNKTLSDKDVIKNSIRIATSVLNMLHDNQSTILKVALSTKNNKVCTGM